MAIRFWVAGLHEIVQSPPAKNRCLIFRKARISNPTFKTFRNIARAEESPSALLLCLSLPLRGRRSAFVALYGFVVYSSVDKAVHALVAGFCVGSEQMARSTSRARSRVIKFVKTLFRVLLFSNAVENVITQDCV